MTIPEHVTAIWEAGKVTNKGDLPLWSGKGAPPAIGSEVNTVGRISHVVTITGYKVEGGWLMAIGVRHSDNKRGDLAGAEIRYPD